MIRYEPIKPATTAMTSRRCVWAQALSLSTRVFVAAGATR